jgi:hypothetical protein
VSTDTSNPAPGQTLDERDDAADFLGDGQGRKVSDARLPAHVDDRRAGFDDLYAARDLGLESTRSPRPSENDSGLALRMPMSTGCPARRHRVRSRRRKLIGRPRSEGESVIAA